MSRIALKSAAVLLALVVAWSATAQAGALEKRSRLELRFGLWNLTQATNVLESGSVQTTAGSSGMVGSFTYAYWLRENLAVNLTVGVLAAETTSHVGPQRVLQRTAGVIPVLLGVRYYPSESTLKTPFRPYLAVAAGPFVGFESKNDIAWDTDLASQYIFQPGQQTASGSGVQGSRYTTTFGAHLGGGVDIQLSRHFMLGANVGYNFMAGFSDPLGGRDNYSGPELAIGLSFLFGNHEP